MKRLNYRHYISIVVLVLVVLSSCAPLKPYERVYVNDPEMQMSSDAGKRFQNYIYTIREAAIPAAAAKSSGGCGCN